MAGLCSLHKIIPGNIPFDFQLDDGTNIERKTMHDLLTSFETGHLGKQLLGADGGLLIIEGAMTGEIPRLTHRYFATICAQIYDQFPGWSIIRTLSIQETILLVRALNDLPQSSRKFRMVENKAKRATTLLGQRLRFLMGLPGLGETMAKKFLADFKTPIEFLRSLKSQPGKRAELWQSIVF